MSALIVELGERHLVSHVVQSVGDPFWVRPRGGEVGRCVVNPARA